MLKLQQNGKDPEGNTRKLKEPWSILAYQIAGDEGLKLLHKDGKAEEREKCTIRKVY